MAKPLFAIASVPASRSGYGEMSRDVINAIIEMDEYDVKIISLPWGGCPMNALDANNPKDKAILDRIVPQPVQLERQPEIFMHIGIPTEAQVAGKFNILYTAGIETTMVSKEWIEAANRMDLILTISEHSKKVFTDTVVQEQNQQGQVVGEIKLVKPIEVLHCAIDTNIFKKIPMLQVPETIKDAMMTVKEDFNFLFVGHWMKGNIGEDRKNVGLLVRAFCETFKNKGSGNRPGLILKTSGAGFSILDRDEILQKIRMVRGMSGPSAPNVYLLHGELTKEEMNGLYNHSKVKAHVSFTKGEGFGIPLLEATQSHKPVIASRWSGQLDFLTPEEALLVGGELKQIDVSAVWDGVLIRESSWFNIDLNQGAGAMHHVFKNYDKLLDKAKSLGKKNAKAFAYENLKEHTAEVLHTRVPRFAMPIPMKLPQLKKVQPFIPKPETVETV